MHPVSSAPNSTVQLDQPSIVPFSSHPLAVLPDDLWLFIFAFQSVSEVVKVNPLISKSIKAIYDNPSSKSILWRQLCVSSFKWASVELDQHDYQVLFKTTYETYFKTLVTSQEEPDPTNLKFKDPNLIVQFAKLRAFQKAGEASILIQKYGFKDEKDRIAVAKIVAAQDGLNVSCYIKNYDIQDQNALANIAEIAVRQDPKNTLAHLYKYGINDMDVVSRIRSLSKVLQDHPEDPKISIQAAEQMANEKYVSGMIAFTQTLLQLANSRNPTQTAGQDSNQEEESTSSYGIKRHGIRIHVSKNLAARVAIPKK